jgi:hypothetical protein
MATSSEPIQELYAATKQVRAQIYERPDGLYQIEFERLMPALPEHEEPSHWSPLNRPKTIVDTIERARELALEGLVAEG